VLRGTIKRIVPRENESINETWTPDRDRFSYEGIYSEDRLQKPMLKEGGEWHEIEWEDALTRFADELKKAAAEKIGILASPGVTIEEAHLLAKLADHLGTANIDHRLRRRDFSDQDSDAVYPSLGCDIADVEKQDAIVLVGSNIRREAPILAHRVRKAALAGAEISFINSTENEYFFDVHRSLADAGLAEMLAGAAVAACGKRLPSAIRNVCSGVSASDTQKAIVKSLRGADEALLLLGNVAGRHRAAAVVRALATAIAEATGAKLGTLSEGPNSAGACLAGVLPHRSQGGELRVFRGLHARDMLGAALDVLMLVNAEPDADITAVADATSKVTAQKFVVALTPYLSESLSESADLLLPVGTFAESSGTFVNVAGTWQSFPGIANPVGQARPTWKVLRVIGNLVDAPGFEYVSSEDVLTEIREQLGDDDHGDPDTPIETVAKPNGADAPADDIDVPIYSVDSVVRRATALQLTSEARAARGEGANQ
jgi:NADH-quinone oxidoreductase subunit G